jgi:hypothetical protein
VLIVEDVEAGQFVQLNARVDYWVRLTAKNFDMVTEVDQCFG